jgi:aryl-phospho-beta-D-glucosidase BglC (GH1 family)
LHGIAFVTGFTTAKHYWKHLTPGYEQEVHHSEETGLVPHSARYPNNKHQPACHLSRASHFVRFTHLYAIIVTGTDTEELGKKWPQNKLVFKLHKCLLIVVNVKGMESPELAD